MAREWECNARLGHVYVCASNADPDVILQPAYDGGD